NQLFERIEAQLCQVLREKRMREGEGYTTDENLLASQLLAFCEIYSQALADLAQTWTLPEGERIPALPEFCPAKESHLNKALTA
ncbi:hypothetical protein MJL81_33765, partial [Salmonella enterica subsp. enterica serovar Anatum]|nr:hypothetical protein [Salmonella enterica subsp. enterica serovar Anatum]